MCTSAPGTGGSTGRGGISGTGEARRHRGVDRHRWRGLPTGGTIGSGTGGSATGAAGSGAAGRGGGGGSRAQAAQPARAEVAARRSPALTSSGYNGRFASETFKDAIIAPGKADHTSWDETFTIPNSVLNSVGTALASSDPVGGTLAVLAGPTLNAAIDATAKPDAYGWVSATAFGVMGDAYYLAQPTAAIEDNYTPIWPGTGLTFQNVPIDCDVRFDVTLIDADLVNDDPIGARPRSTRRS